jgi:hypothetical protein
MKVPEKFGTHHADKLQDYLSIMRIPHTVATSEDHCHRTTIINYRDKPDYTLNVLHHGTGKKVQ